MAMETAREMLVYELGGLLDAETRLRNVLVKMAKKCNNQNLKALFEDHRDETEEQAERLRQIFDALEEKAKRQPCKGMRGLIEEFETFVKEEKPRKGLFDVYACGMAIKLKHYEISAYDALIQIARQIGLEEEAGQLDETRREEQALLQRLQQIGQELIAQLPPETEEDTELDEDEDEYEEASAARTRPRHGGN